MQYQKDPASLIKSAAALKGSMKGMLRIEDKGRQLVPLTANETQRRIIETAYGQRDSGLPVRIIVLKGRQQGATTGIGGYCFLHALCQNRTNSLIITEEKSASAMNVYSKYRLFHEHWPVPVETAKSQHGQMLKYGPPVQSMIKVEGEKMISSFTYHQIHLSEATLFQDLKSVMGMLMQTVPDNPDTAVFLESAYQDSRALNSRGQFQDEWERAASGASEFHALFIPWYAHEEYQIPFTDETEKQRFKSSLSGRKDHEFGDEIELLERHPLSPENLHWRRRSIKNKCNGRLSLFCVQYPTTPEEAFVSMRHTFFDFGALSWYLSEEVRKPKTIGYFEHSRGKPIFVDDPAGIVSIWEPPEPYREYIGGSDHAEGLDTGDHNAGVIINRLPLRQVAQLRGYDGRRVDIEEFAEQFVYLCRFYSNAWMCPENNKDGGTVCYAVSHTHKYHRLVSESIITGNRSKRFGWLNTGSTRKRGLGLVQTAIGHKEISIPDEKLIRECMGFVTKAGRPEAEKKGKARQMGDPESGYYDDLIFSLVGAMLLHNALRPPKSARMAKNQEQESFTREKQRQSADNIWNYV